jgi:hypothetical protein
MIIEMIGLGFVFAAATLAAIAYERRMDVLYGPYIEGSASDQVGVLVERFWKPTRAVSDRLRWKARNMAYLASVIAC